MILSCSELHRSAPDLMERLWSGCADAVYSLEPRERQLGLGEEVSCSELGLWLAMDQAERVVY